MRQKILIAISALLAIMVSSCGSSNYEKNLSSDITIPIETTTPSETYAVTASKVKFEPFNNVDNVRQKLSAVGIGELGSWRDNEMGGFMSITTYYQFGSDNPSNNLAYYLESDNPGSIKTLKLVLNINNGNKKPALLKFAETVVKTHEVLGLAQNNQIINAAKIGKEIKVDKDSHTEKIELEKSRIETWEFVIETK